MRGDARNRCRSTRRSKSPISVVTPHALPLCLCQPGFWKFFRIRSATFIRVEPRHPAAAEMNWAPERSATCAHLGMLGTLGPNHSLTHCAGQKEAMRVGV
jgi:hypothetical protein